MYDGLYTPSGYKYDINNNSVTINDLSGHKIFGINAIHPHPISHYNLV